DMVALEWEDDLRLVHGDHPRQRDCQVIAQPNSPSAMILEGVHQLFVLSGLAGEHLDVFDCRGIERIESMPLEDILESPDDLLAENHLFRQVVPKPLQNRWFSCGVAHNPLLSNLIDDMRDFWKDQVFHGEPDGVA